LLALGALAKPSFAIALIPGLGAFALAGWVRFRPALATLAWAIVPTLVILVLQDGFLNRTTTEIGGGGIAFGPISGPPYGWSMVGWSFFLPLLWIVAALAVSGRDFLGDLGVQLVGTCLAVAIAIWLLFVETGPRAGHGNLGVPAQVCSFLLILLAIRSIGRTVESLRRDPRATRWRQHGLLVILAIAFLLGGALSILEVFGLTTIPYNWTVF
jgi:hypothetical protein